MTLSNFAALVRFTLLRRETHQKKQLKDFGLYIKTNEHQLTMNLTTRQRADLETVRYFIPTTMSDTPITDSDIERFFAYSERGEGESKGKFASSSGYDALLQGKRWREWHMRAWEETVLEGTIPYWTLLGGERPDEVPPRSVVEYMKKSMFGGIDASLIEDVYQRIHYEHQ